MVRFESENPWLDCAGSKTEDTPVMQQQKQQDDLVHVEKNIRARLVDLLLSFDHRPLLS